MRCIFSKSKVVKHQARASAAPLSSRPPATAGCSTDVDPKPGNQKSRGITSDLLEVLGQRQVDFKGEKTNESLIGSGWVIIAVKIHLFNALLFRY